MSMSSTRIMYDFIVYYNNVYTLCNKAFKLIVISEKKYQVKMFLFDFLHMLHIVSVWCIIIQ